MVFFASATQEEKEKEYQVKISECITKEQKILEFLKFKYPAFYDNLINDFEEYSKNEN